MVSSVSRSCSAITIDAVLRCVRKVIFEPRCSFKLIYSTKKSSKCLIIIPCHKGVGRSGDYLLSFLNLAVNGIVQIPSQGRFTPG